MKRENGILLIWIGVYFFVFFMSVPIKGDMFAQIPVVYAYMFATFLMVWFLRFFVKILTMRLALKLSVLILTFAFLYPAVSYFLNGKGTLICNAAEYNYPTVLYLLLDKSNKEEMEWATDCAGFGDNKQILSGFVSPKKDLNEIDLTTIKHIVPKGRAQDGILEDEDFRKLSIADDLIAHGKYSIPFLITKLDDETEMKRQTIDFWYEVYVGDVALIILNDFFTRDDGTTSTIPGFSWDEFLERGNDKDSMGEQILRNYIEKHGRKNIKERWQKMWDDNKENIFWDKTEKCFKIE